MKQRIARRRCSAQLSAPGSPATPRCSNPPMARNRARIDALVAAEAADPLARDPDRANRRRCARCGALRARTPHRAARARVLLQVMVQHLPAPVVSVVAVPAYVIPATATCEPARAPAYLLE